MKILAVVANRVIMRVVVFPKKMVRASQMKGFLKGKFELKGHL